MAAKRHSLRTCPGVVQRLSRGRELRGSVQSGASLDSPSIPSLSYSPYHLLPRGSKPRSVQCPVSRASLKNTELGSCSNFVLPLSRLSVRDRRETYRRVKHSISALSSQLEKQGSYERLPDYLKRASSFAGKTVRVSRGKRHHLE